MASTSFTAASAIVVVLSLFSPEASSTASHQEQQAAFVQGQAMADETLAAMRLQPIGTLEAKPAGYLIAEGDSWFDYPGLDVLGALSGGRLADGSRYKVYTAASAGDTVESMAFDPNQRQGFLRQFVNVADAGKKQDVKAILLSGGGNDIAGREFYMLLNNANSPTGALSPLDGPVADAIIDRVARSLESLIGTAAQFSERVLGRRDIPILIHGYGQAVPDGRPFLFGWPLPGPWLQPGFAAKGYLREGDADALEKNTQVVADLIDRFNNRIARIPAALSGVADVRYVDVRPVMHNTVAGSVYKQDWANELHPRDAAFVRVAEAFHTAILKK
jgi:hypothetical protein